MVTSRLVLRVPKIPPYSKKNLPHGLRAGLSAMLQGEALGVHAFGGTKDTTPLGTGVPLPPASF